MSQRGAWDVSVMNHLTETNFGETLTTGTWLPVSLVKSFEPRYMPGFKPKVGIGRQNPSNWTLAKHHYEFDLELEIIRKEASPAYDWYTLAQYIIEKASGADGVPGNTLESFSLAAKINVDTPEYWILAGCMPDRVDIIGSSVEETVTMKIHGLAQTGDYSTTDPCTLGDATRQAQPSPKAPLLYGNCDILYDPSSPSSIFEDVSSFRLSLIRNLEKRGKGSTAITYRDFVPTTRRWELEITKDFDSATELEHFIDATETMATVKIPYGAGGKTFTMHTGYWMPPSGLPIRELDLLNLRLVGEFSYLAVSTQ